MRREDPAPSGWGTLVFTSLLLVCVTPAHGATLGFIEEFAGPGTGNWSGMVQNFTNPGTGGYLGPADGYLLAETTAPWHWGQRCDACPEYMGDWLAAGITQVRIWLNDVGAPDPFSIHFAFGNGRTFWQYDPGFSPPNGSWAEYVVDMTDSASFTQTIGTQPFAVALHDVNKVLIRHALAPFMQIPDNIQGDAGIDHLLLTNGVVGVEPRDHLVLEPVRLAPPYPNPSRGPVTVAIEGGGSASVSIQVIDVAGRVVRRAELPDASPGPRLWFWDGRDVAGRLVSPGTYRIHATGPTGGTSRSLIRIR
jgi:FlgD Ig-like domain